MAVSWQHMTVTLHRGSVSKGRLDIQVHLMLLKGGGRNIYIYIYTDCGIILLVNGSYFVYMIAVCMFINICISLYAYIYIHGDCISGLAMFTAMLDF